MKLYPYNGLRKNVLARKNWSKLKIDNYLFFLNPDTLLNDMNELSEI